jgi:hypothetical protein
VVVDLDPRYFDGTTALECATQITQVLEHHERVLLVGTSCAGIIIPVVTMLRPIDHLVFVCAGLPDIGRSATDQIFNDGLLHDYLLGTKDQIISQRWARGAVPARLGHSPIELPTGHCPQNSKPELVADILTRLAKPER